MQPNKNDEQLSRWKGGHWREIACFSGEIQKELYEEFKGKYWLKEVTVTQLKEHIAEYFCVIKNAIWPLHSFKGHTTKRVIYARIEVTR